MYIFFDGYFVLSYFLRIVFIIDFCIQLYFLYIIVVSFDFEVVFGYYIRFFIVFF